MKNLLTVISLWGILIISPARAVVTSGEPSPNLFPTFGTLVNFDDKAVGTAVGQYDYVSLGITSIVETEGLGFFGRYDSTQSKPCYVGTGDSGERGTDISSGWDGTIEINLAFPADKIGIGVANTRGPDTLSIYNSQYQLLESYTIKPEDESQLNLADAYIVFTRDSCEISRLTIVGDFFAIDDLQFTPEPATICLLGSGVNCKSSIAKKSPTIVRREISQLSLVKTMYASARFN